MFTYHGDPLGFAFCHGTALVSRGPHWNSEEKVLKSTRHWLPPLAHVLKTLANGAVVSLLNTQRVQLLENRRIGS